MNRKLIIAIVGIGVAIALLVTSAVKVSAAKVVTVTDIVASGADPKRNLRLGARVSDGEIFSQTAPELLLRFQVHDIGKSEPHLTIEYRGVMPDTLRAGRDVIVEGKYDGEKFVAQTLLTQCPSKYEPPTPNGS